MTSIMAGDGKQIKVTLRRSPICRKPMHKKTLIAMGLRKLNQTVFITDNAATRGMVKTVDFMVDAEYVDGVDSSS